MARSRLSPVPLCSELQSKMQVTPEVLRHERDPCRFASWDQTRTNSSNGFPYPRFFNSDSFLPANLSQIVQQLQTVQKTRYHKADTWRFDQQS